MTNTTGVQRRKLSKGYKYRYHLYFKGKKVFSPAIYDTEYDALKARNDRMLELAANPFDVNINLFHLMEERIKYLYLNRSRNYARETERSFETVKEALGNIPVTSITKGMVKALLNQEAKRLKANGSQNYQVNNMIAILRAFFYYCINDHDIQMNNPCTGIQFYRIDKKTKYIPSDDEMDFVRMLLETHKESIRFKQMLLFDFVRETGARINEPLNMDVKDIHYDKGLITLYTKKNKNSDMTFRHIPLPDCLYGKQNELPSSGKVFKHWTTYPKFLNDTFNQYNASCKPEFRIQTWAWHNMRHAAASRWANSGMSLIEIQARLGHHSIGVTQRYLQNLGFTDYSVPFTDRFDFGKNRFKELENSESENESEIRADF